MNAFAPSGDFLQRDLFVGDVGKLPLGLERGAESFSEAVIDQLLIGGERLQHDRMSTSPLACIWNCDHALK